MRLILVLNAGSSSLKAQVFDETLQPVIGASVTEIGAAGQITCGDTKAAISAKDHTAALDALLQALSDAGYPLTAFAAAAHRVVHGGDVLTRPVAVSPAVITAIEGVIPLAPLHNPHNLAGIRALQTLAPDLPQYCSFDTAFHASNPAVATRYAIAEMHYAAGIRRYGFHGLSYANLVAEMGPTLPPRLLAFHLGNGASLCAIAAGHSVACSMGYSPLSGLTMGTRSGDIDPSAVLRLAEENGTDGAAQILNAQSGLLGLADETNMKTLLERDDDEAAFAVAHFCYWAARHAGSAIVAMDGVDAIAFTGGIGENAAPVRDGIMTHLACFGELPVHVITAAEEKQIARDALSLMEASK